MSSPHVTYLAHHWLLLAGPAFLPAVAAVAVMYVAIKDRRTRPDDDDAERSDAEERRL